MADERATERPNLVVSLTSKSLTAQGDQAILAIGGQVDGWTCVGKAKSEILWEMRKVGPIKTKVTSEPFQASIPISFVKQGANSVAVQLEQPIVKPEGHYVSVTNNVLR